MRLTYWCELSGGTGGPITWPLSTVARQSCGCSCRGETDLKYPPFRLQTQSKGRISSTEDSMRDPYGRWVYCGGEEIFEGGCCGWGLDDLTADYGSDCALYFS